MERFALVLAHTHWPTRDEKCDFSRDHARMMARLNDRGGAGGLPGRVLRVVDICKFKLTTATRCTCGQHILYPRFSHFFRWNKCAPGCSKPREYLAVS